MFMLTAYLVLLCEFFWEFSIFRFCRPLVDIYWHPLLIHQLHTTRWQRYAIFSGNCSYPPTFCLVYSIVARAWIHKCPSGRARHVYNSIWANWKRTNIKKNDVITLYLPRHRNTCKFQSGRKLYPRHYTFVWLFRKEVVPGSSTRQWALEVFSQSLALFSVCLWIKLLCGVTTAVLGCWYLVR